MTENCSPTSGSAPHHPRSAATKAVASSGSVRGKRFRTHLPKPAITKAVAYRAHLLSAALIALAFLLAALHVSLGEYSIALSRVFAIFFGDRTSRVEATIVLDWRMPRAITGCAVGAALGLSGAITQSLTRNSLASPDILGVTAGASAAAVSAIILGPSTGFLGWLAGAGIPLTAFFGASATAGLVWVPPSAVGDRTPPGWLSSAFCSQQCWAHTSTSSWCARSYWMQPLRSSGSPDH